MSHGAISCTLFKIRWRHASEPRAIIALVTDLALALADPLQNLGNLFRREARPIADRAGQRFARRPHFLTHILAEAERGAVVGDAQVALGDQRPDFGGIVERVLDIALAGQNIA